MMAWAEHGPDAEAWFGKLRPLWADLERGRLMLLLSAGLDTGFLDLHGDLPLNELRVCSAAREARRFLLHLDQQQGVKLTAAGNLSRHTVSEMMEQMVWPDFDLVLERSVSNVLNEADVTALHYLHLILRRTRLVRRAKGTLRCTRSGRALLDEAAAGALMSTLFATTLRDFNLAYFDPFPVEAWPQQEIVLVLFLLGAAAADWERPDTLMRLTTVPIPEVMALRSGSAAAAFESRVLRYLHWFGLMEERSWWEEGEWGPCFVRVYRKSPLYDRFFSYPRLGGA